MRTGAYPGRRSGHGLAAVLVALAAACTGPESATGPEAPNRIDGSGDVIQLQDGQVKLDVPPGAVSSPIEVEARRISDPPDVPGLLPGAVFGLEPASATFSRPVELTIRYQEDELPAGATEASLGIYRATGDGWVLADEPSVDSARNHVRGLIHGFGTFAVVSDHPCVQVVEFQMGGGLAGELSPADCTIWDGRVIDKLGVSFPDQTVFRASVSSGDFTGSLYTARIAEGTERIVSARIGSVVQIVPSGHYQLWPTSLESEESTGSTVLGNYELQTGLVEGDPTAGCGPVVAVASGVTVDGSITADDCEETDDEDPEVVRRTDEYLLNVGRYEMATVTLTADFTFNLIAWTRDRLVAGAFNRAPGSTATVVVDPPRVTELRFGALSEEEGATGSYTISFRVGPREEQGQ